MSLLPAIVFCSIWVLSIAGMAYGVWLMFDISRIDRDTRQINAEVRRGRLNMRHDP